MGGYSYGAMVTAQLPPLAQILEPFACPRADSHAAQIRLRAQHLAEQQNLILGSMRSAMQRIRNPHDVAKRPGVRVGGHEGDRSPRRSHDGSGRRSFSLDAEEKFRKGVHEFMAKRKAKHPHLHWSSHRRPASSELARGGTGNAQDGGTTEAEVEKEEEQLPAVAGLVRPRPAYLLVSPLQGVVTHLAAMSLLPSKMKQHDDAAEEKLVSNPALAVFGDNDGFVPVGKLRAWMARLCAKQGSLFTGREVATGGHFWGEEGVLYLMTEYITTFSDALIRRGAD
jgi:hypothetical protein